MAKKKQAKRGLGRGLSALMADVVPVQEADAQSDEARGILSIPIEKIHANREQPRQQFDKDKLDELAASLREKGVLQPLIVRINPNKTTDYQIIAGERRWRAAQLAKLHELPVIVRDYSDDEVLEIAIIENVQRADLNAVEEATGYRQLMDRFGHTQEKLAEGLSKSRSHIANLLRLLNLPHGVLNLVRDGRLSAGHARALITADNPSELAGEVIRNRLSVRETELLVKRVKSGKAPRKAPVKSKDADTLALENDLSANLKMKVSIDHKSSDGSGQVVIKYRDMDELDELCRLMSAG